MNHLITLLVYLELIGLRVPVYQSSSSVIASCIVIPMPKRTSVSSHLCHVLFLHFGFQKAHYSYLLLLQKESEIFLFIGAIHAPHIPTYDFFHWGLWALPPFCTYPL